MHIFREKNGRKIPVEKRYELCQANTLSEYDNIAIKSLYLKECNELADHKEVIQLAEQYANGGITLLIETTLKERVYEDDNGEWHNKPKFFVCHE